MISALHRLLPPVPAFVRALTPESAVNIVSKSFALIKRNTSLVLPPLLALGYDVAARNPVSSISSITSIMSFFSLSLFAYRNNFGTKALQCLPRPYPLLIAMYYNLPETIQRLIQSGHNPNDTYREMPLLAFAAYLDRPEVMKTMLQNGAHVNALSKEQMSPLHIAALSKSLEAARVLMSHNADPCAGDQLNSPFSIAKDNVPMCKILLGKEKSTVFDRCENFHEMCDLIFSIDNPDLLQQIKKSQAVRKFEDMAASLAAQPHQNFHLVIARSNSLSLQSLRQKLMQSSPFFAEAYKLADSPEVVFSNTEDYDPIHNHIHLKKRIAIEALSGIIFHTFMALYREEIALQRSLLLQGNLSRSSYMAHQFYIFHFANEKTKQVLALIHLPTDPPRTRAEEWNALTVPKLLALGWDLSHFAKFYSNNKDFIQRKMDQLEVSAAT